MFYIIGASHDAQIKEKGAAETQAQNEFHTCLEQAVQRIEPALIAEELSDYALVKRGREKGAAQESLTKTIANSCKVEHRFCDPDDKARARIGYMEAGELSLRIWQTHGKNLSSVELSLRASAVEVAKYWPLRERFWLDQLSDMHKKQVIFVCGDAHVETFRELLKNHKIESTVEARHIGVTPYDDTRSAEIGLYLKSHPEVFD
jgi:hypothetical protein